MRHDQVSRRRWLRSSRCQANGTCVEVARFGGRNIAVRDSGAGTRHALHFTPAQWLSFSNAVRDGRYDL